MLDLSALRAAALQTRRTTSDNGYRDDQEEGEIFDPTSLGSHDHHNHNTHDMSNRITQEDTLTRSYRSQPSISSTTIPQSVVNTSQEDSEKRNLSIHHSKGSPVSSITSDDNDVESELVNLSDMGIAPSAFINFGIAEDAIVAFCRKYGLPIPRFPEPNAESIQNMSIQQNAFAQDPKTYNTDLSNTQAQYNSADTDDVTHPQPYPSTDDLKAQSNSNTESDMEISDISDQDQDQDQDREEYPELEHASDSDIEEDMEIEDSVGTSTIIMTASRVDSGDHWADPETQTSSTQSIQTHQELTTGPSLHHIVKSTAQTGDQKAKKVAQRPSAKINKQAKSHRQQDSLIQARNMDLLLDVSRDSEVMTDLAQEYFRPVLPELESQPQRTSEGREKEATAAVVAATTDTDALTARFKQIADMKKMIEQMEQSKKKEKILASDGESPSPSGVGSVTPQPSAIYDQSTTNTPSITSSPLNEDMQEAAAELVARAQVVVKSANAQQLSALKATDDQNVNQLLESLEQNDESPTGIREDKSSSTALANEDVVMSDTSVSDKNGTSSFNSPFTEYEEQLKSLQQLEDDQDEALRSIEAKIEEMKKQQETMRLQKELARTKALGVRAKLSMLQRASASPKIQSPVSTSKNPSTQPSPSPAKRPSPYVEESSTTGEMRHGSLSRTGVRHQAKRGKFDRPVVESMPNADVEAARITMDEIIHYPRNDTLPLFNEIRDRLAKVISTEGFRIKEKSVHLTDNRHDHIRVVKRPQDFLEYYMDPPSPQNETLDTPSLNQPDVSVNLKDHGRSHDMTEFQPYQSPLHRFRSFQYFGGPSNKSMAYSNPVDTSKNLCAFELAGGTCNDDTCRSRHFRDFDLSPTDVMQDLLTYSRGENDGMQMKDQKTLERMFATMDAARTKKPATYVRAALDIRRRNLSGNQLQKVSFIPSPARRQEVIKRKKGGQHTVKPVAQKLPMTSALQPMLIPGSTVELRYFEVDERNYPTDAKNIPGWVRAVVQALPSSQFADYDKANSKSLDLNAAINILRQALARNPTSDLLWCLYVELWMYRGDEKMFEREMEQAVRNVPYCLDLMWYNVLLASTVEDQLTASDNLLRYFNSDEAIKTIGIVAREQNM
ncbi:hypothetical protein K450DRAFT_243718 [Umbelopsis ramanniana AG]|uniref:Putative zinc-finger domain-containing protein n=1 Tax=Umbelopsis ramanniana AG TaxID=1314678 RepID=A0AAD5E994_UMBRA|nr:uncharacterized protein K450DRAFT_243718 [Umbelopsis ramanniana AG]KAI8579072.1 hypothetical protein K450DRAFT_243718 [Umbelopsis ramanniana AG]